MNYMVTQTYGTSLGRKMRILIVEDNAATRLAMSRLMRDAGAEVVTARDGEEGLGYLLTQRFDVLLTDLRTAGDGWIRAIAPLPETPRQPSSEPDHRHQRRVRGRALRGQPVQFLPKPFNIDALLEMIGGKPN